MSGLELVIDSVPVVSPGGERLQIELAAAVDRTCPAGAHAVVLCRPDQGEIAGLEAIDVERVTAPAATRLQRWRWLRGGLIERVRQLSATATFAGSGIVTPALARTCGVIGTANNMVPFADEILSDYPPLTRMRFRLARALTVRSLRIADAVVLHSEHALRAVSRYAGDIGSKTIVVPTGIPRDTRDVDISSLRHPYDGRPYFLYFSAIRRYKNHLGLIEAYRRLAGRIDDLPDLLLAGIDKDPSALAAIRAAISRTTLGDRVRYLGELPRDSVAGWLHHATVNVFPSLCETSSVIQAEILGLHGVMATSEVPPMSEVAADAAELFDPRDPDDIAHALEHLWRSPQRRSELRRLAAARCRELSWDACGMAIWRAASAASDSYRVRVGGSRAGECAIS